MEFAQVLDYNQMVCMHGGMEVVLEVRANRLFARAIRAIEALRRDEGQHRPVLPIYLQTWGWGFDPDPVIQQTIECVADAASARIYLVGAQTELQQQLAAQGMAGRLCGVIGPDSTELDAIRYACTDLQQGVVSECVVISCTPAADSSSAKGQLVAIAVFGNARRASLPDQLQLDLSISEPDSGRHGNLSILELPADTPLLAALILIAERAAGELAAGDELAEQLSIAQLSFPDRQCLQGYALLKHEREYTAVVQLKPVDALSAAESDLQPPTADNTRERLLGMLAQVSGYSPAQVAAAAVAGRTLQLDSLMAAEFSSLFQQAFGKPLPATKLLDRPSVEQLLSRLVAQLSVDEAADLFVPAGTDQADDRVGPYQASQAQTAMYLQSRIMPGHIGHVLRYVQQVRSDIDINILQQALRALAERHPMLTAKFGTENGQVQIQFAARSAIPLQVDRCDALHSQAVQHWIEQYSTESLDLEHGPLCRMHLTAADHAADSSHSILMLVVHHIVADFVSLEVIWRDLESLYVGHAEGTGNPLPATGFAYADLTGIAEWQAASPAAQLQRAYWRKQLQQAPEPLTLGHELAGARQSCSGYEFQRVLEQRLASDINLFAQQTQVTEFLVMFSIYAMLLLQRAQSASLCIGVTTDGRDGHPGRDLVGCFVNTVPVIFNNELLDLSLTGLLQQQSSSIRQALASDRVPFLDMLQLGQVNRQPGRPVLFQTLFTWLAPSRQQQHQQSRHSLQRKHHELDQGSMSRIGVTHDIVLAIHNRPEHKVCNWAFDEAVYAGQDIVDLAQAYETLLRRAMEVPDMPLRNLLDQAVAKHTDSLERERFVL